VKESFALGLDGTRLYVRRRCFETGSSPDVVAGLNRPTAVLCDGIACDGFIWKYLWNDLARVLNVAHWHYRGHGRSSSPADPRRIEFTEHVRDLEAVLDAIGSDPPGRDASAILVGHSMGCQVALEACRSNRARIRGLILICGAPGRITHTFKGTNVLAQMLPRLIARVDAYPGLARALWSLVPADLGAKVAKLMGEVERTIRVDDLVPYMQHMVDIDIPMFLRMLRSAGEHTAEDLLPSLDVPVLVIAGDRDSFTPPAYAEAMAAQIPDAELLMVAGGTHVVPLEQPEMVRIRIEQFVRERVLAG
jgi:pimeloyl-ACP methyl ester carboxylesterase